MSATLKSLKVTLLELLGRGRGNASSQKYASLEAPLRAELFSADQMEAHGTALAAVQTLAKARGADKLLARLAANETALLEACELLRDAVKTP